jgi:drug/metabolite transporter (DMT)-like permease
MTAAEREGELAQLNGKLFTVAKARQELPCLCLAIFGCAVSSFAIQARYPSRRGSPQQHFKLGPHLRPKVLTGGHWMRVTFLLIAAILLQGTGNLCLSRGMKDLASTAAEHPIELTALVSPLNMTGVLLLVGFFAIFTTVLARADLSVVVPIVSFEIVVNVALADLVIHEKVSVLRWAGTLLITCGVALVAFSARKGAGQQ